MIDIHYELTYELTYEHDRRLTSSACVPNLLTPDQPSSAWFF